jgi:hypothetical protein
MSIDELPPQPDIMPPVTRKPCVAARCRAGSAQPHRSSRTSGRSGSQRFRVQPLLTVRRR